MTNGVEPQKKKGLHPLAWVAIGCGAIIMVGVVVMLAVGLFVGKKVRDFADEADGNPGLAVAKLAVKANPELELVDEDADEGTLTIRNSKTGEVVTVDYRELKDGKLSFRSGEKEMTFKATAGDEDGEGTFAVTGTEGTATFGTAGEAELPDWVPAYPGSEPRGQFAMTTEDGRSATFQFTTSDAAADVVSFYKKALEDEGMEAVANTMTSGDEITYASVQGSTEGRSVSILVSIEDDATNVVLNFTEGEQ